MLQDSAELDQELVRALFDIRGELHQAAGGSDYAGDLHADLRAARESGPVHAAPVGEVLGHSYRTGVLAEHSAPIYSAFDFATVNTVLRDPDVYSSAVYDSVSEMFGKNILQMGGSEHTRYRGLVQHSFARSMVPWWADNWIEHIVEVLLRRIEGQGRADLNLDLCALLPLLTITSSFGIEWHQALQLRTYVETMLGAGRPKSERLAASAAIADMLRPVVVERRRSPQDDLITVLTRETIVDENGDRHLLGDDEILGFARLVLTAGSGTTWRQLAIVLWALLGHPDQLDAVQRDRSLVRPAIEEALRWEVTDPTFHRLVTRDTVLGGVPIPAGAVIEICLAAANLDPARWADPERFDITRPIRPHLAFATGPHVCLGMHVARAEMAIALNAVLDRFPRLRWDPQAPRPALLGLTMRGPAEVPVVFS
ncbi:cytochrome P450 [Pseudonocardia pini]|uniref:cytochrome P450 n=1 Tax=Pseudonocardia pini TaxID=2758030 RepID=UPI0015F026E7|nr:cytochrome P450 [Pseudonocardia pini]